MGERVRPIEALGAVGLLVLVGLHAAAPITCTDFFWHLKLGQIIAANGSIPSTDLFSAVHPESAYVQPQWLWEWLAAHVYRLGGFAAIRGFQALVLVSSFAGLYCFVRRVTARASAAFLVCWLALMLFEDRFRARPDAMTLGFVVLTLPIVMGRFASTRALLAYTFGLALVWANMHGGASILLILSLLALMAGAVIEGVLGDDRASSLRATLQLLAVAVLGALCSPTLVRGLAHWATLIGPQIQTGNEEWMPTYTVLTQGITPCTVLIAIAPTLVFVAYVCEQIAWTRKHRRSVGAIGEWFLCAGYLALSQQAIRNVFLCIVPVIFMLRRRADSPARWLNPALLAGTAVVAIITLQDVVDRSYGGLKNAQSLFHYDLLPDTYPEEAANFLEEAGIRGGMFNEGKWGGYLIFRAWPASHVFVDSRQNMTSQMWQVFLATLSIPTRVAALDEAQRRWDVELAVFRGPTFPLGVPPAHWQLLYKAGDQEVYQHRSGRHARENERRTLAWLSAHGVQPHEDLTQSATRIGAETWLATPFQKQTMRRALAETQRQDPKARAEGYVHVGEIYYRAGLMRPALSAFSAAERLGPMPARAIYLDAFCSFATGDYQRARTKMGNLVDLRGLSRRQTERLSMLAEELRSKP